MSSEDTHVRKLKKKEKEAKPSSSDSHPKIWKCGEPFEYPLPEPDPKCERDPWGILLTPILEKDKAQCDAWKDEVQNLLLFASLFSAVVTAFVIETYKGLQQDPSSTIILILSQIANNLEDPGISSSKSIPTSLPPFSPTPSIVRVNIFLFLSLILSLTTVLIGIVSLQWLREHQRYTGHFTPENTFAAVHMRSEALEKWHVPEIFSALPLILQTALILFFVGIIDFLMDIDARVVVPVALIIGLNLGFLLLTTVLPTFQAFVLHHPNLKANAGVPSPCPYSSPQSRAFRQLLTSSKLVFFATSFTFSTIYGMVIRLCLLPGRVLDSPFYRWIKEMIQNHSFFSLLPSPSFLTNFDPRVSALFRLNDSNDRGGFDYMTCHIHGMWSLGSSFDFDTAWLVIRDNYFQSICNQDNWLYQNRLDHEKTGGLYDVTRGLCKELMKDDVNINADLESPIFTAYHCAIDQSSINQLTGNELINAVRTRTAYISTLTGYNQLAPLHPFLDKLNSESIHFTPFLDKQESIPTLSLLWDEYAFVFLRFANSKLAMLDMPSAQLSKHLAELYFRLLGCLYSQPYLTSLSNAIPPKLLFSGEELYVMPIFNDGDQPFTTQWAFTIDLYFRAFEDVPNSPHIDFKSSFHGHPFIREYIWNFWREVQSEFAEKNIHSDTLKQTLRTFSRINMVLTTLIKNNNRNILDCVFYPAVLYAQICRQFLLNHATLQKAIDGLIPTFKQCKVLTSRDDYYQQLFRNDGYDDGQEWELFSDDWWQVLSLDLASYPSRHIESE